MLVTIVIYILNQLLYNVFFPYNLNPVNVFQDNNPFNMRIVNLNNFPMAQSVYRANYRSHSVACVRAK